MNNRLPGAKSKRRTGGKAHLALAVVSLLLLSTFTSATAQQRFSKKYPARQNVRLQLVNLFGTITVEAWNRNEIKISASMDSPVARLTPRWDDGNMLIDVADDNRGRGDVGDVNFTINVPVNSTVDIETKRGNISINGVEGAMVSARVSLDGDINLTSIRASTVMAQNRMGDILFDGYLLAGGKYTFTTTQGNINLRVPTSSEFSIEATAPTTRYIDLGAFSNRGVNSISDGRKCVGSIGNGRSSLYIYNQRGRIAFLRR